MYFYRYIERFRHGRPQSRAERRQMISTDGGEQIPFWWMIHSSVPSSNPGKSLDKGTLSVGVFMWINHELVNFALSFSNKHNIRFFSMNGCSLSLKDGHDSTTDILDAQPQHDIFLNVSALISLLKLNTVKPDSLNHLDRKQIGVLQIVII